MIPSMNASSVLPPFIGEEPGARASMSPYEADIREFVTRFATSLERVTILRGLLSYRRELRAVGVVDGWQWLDGSFVEDVEAIRKRAPADIDLVTFSRVPVPAAEKSRFAMANLDLFDRNRTKALYKCDAFFVDLDKRPELLVDDSRYWFGLFSHQRETALWKGMVKVSMQTQVDDDAAVALLDQFERDLGGGRNAQET
jgi:hypothetical protein